MVWERSPVTDRMSFDPAVVYSVARVATGRKGWRLSAVEELLSLVDFGATNRTRAKAGGTAVARADVRRTFPLRSTEEPGSGTLTATRASDGAAAQRRGTQGNATITAIRFKVLAENGLPGVAPLRKGERVMLDRKRLDTFYQELQTASRIEANTPKTRVQSGKKILSPS